MNPLLKTFPERKAQTQIVLPINFFKLRKNTNSIHTFQKRGREGYFNSFLRTI